MSDDDAVHLLYSQIRTAVGVDAEQVGDPATPVPAAVIALWRERAGRGEVYLVQRAPKLAFMGGYWTFPGGRAEPGDRDLEHAAARELAEETGVQLPAPLANAIDLGRWVTPAFLPQRFDTRYFMVRVGNDAAPDTRHSGGELTGGAWVEPAEAVRRFESAVWMIPSPVLRVLRQLAAHGLSADIVARVAEQAAQEAASPRLWYLAPAIAVCPVRTPTLPPATHTNCYIVGDRELVVIDPASPFADEQAALEVSIDQLVAAGARVRAVWLTHHHRDHVGGAVRVSERYAAPIAAHRATADRLGSAVPVTVILDDGDTIDLAGEPRRRLSALFTPGHAPGHHCFVEQQTGFVAAGDMVAGIGTILIDPSEGDMAVYLASLERIRAGGPRVLLPAHGGAIADADARLVEYVRHRLWREQRVVDAIRAAGAASASELVPIAYDDVVTAIWPLAERSLRAHLVKLAADGVVAQEGEMWRIAAG